MIQKQYILLGKTMTQTPDPPNPISLSDIQNVFGKGKNVNPGDDLGDFIGITYYETVYPYSKGVFGTTTPSTPSLHDFYSKSSVDPISNGSFTDITSGSRTYKVPSFRNQIHFEIWGAGGGGGAGNHNANGQPGIDGGNSSLYITGSTVFSGNNSMQAGGGLGGAGAYRYGIQNGAGGRGGSTVNGDNSSAFGYSGDQGNASGGVGGNGGSSFGSGVGGAGGNNKPGGNGSAPGGGGGGCGASVSPYTYDVFRQTYFPTASTSDIQSFAASTYLKQGSSQVSGSPYTIDSFRQQYFPSSSTSDIQNFVNQSYLTSGTQQISTPYTYDVFRLKYFPNAQLSDVQSFVSQTYSAFLNRKPDEGGLVYWYGQYLKYGTTVISQFRSGATDSPYGDLTYISTGTNNLSLLFFLPNSNLCIQCSRKRFYRQNYRK